MQFVYQITLTILLAGVAFGAPSEDQPAAASVSKPADQPSLPDGLADSEPPSVTSTSADHNIKAAEESLKLVRTQLKDAVSAILAPVFNANDLAYARPNIKAAEESLRKLQTQLLDAVAAIGTSDKNNADELRASVEATVSVPEAIKPIENGLSAIKTYKQIIGQFITELIQIPIVFLHAFSDAISGLTGSKTPTIIYQAAGGAGVAGATAVTVQTSPTKEST